MTVGYTRVSTDKQQLLHQKREIERFALKHNLVIDCWKEEVASGTKSKDCRIIGKVLRKMKKDDILIVSELSRLSRTMLDIFIILHYCIHKGIIIYTVKENLTFCDTIDSKILGFAFGFSAELERNLISSRTKEALACKKSQGVILGRPKGSSKKLSLLQQHDKEIKQWREQKVSCTEIAKRLHVSRSTLFKHLKQQKGN